MAYRELELTLLSARDLKNVNLFLRMDVYAVASISGDPTTRQCTPTDTSGGRNPSWNTTVRFPVPPSAAAAGGGCVHVLLRSERALGDRDVGEAVLPLAELLADGPRAASYQVHTVPRGEPRGVLSVSYRLGPVVAPVGAAGDDKQKPVVAYPVPEQPFKPQNHPPPPPQTSCQYHHPPDAYAPPSYQYHPPQHDCAYAPPPPPPYRYHHPPHDAYAPPPRHHAYAPPPPQYYHPHDSYAPPPPQYYYPPHHDTHAPPRHDEEARSSPAKNGKSNNNNGGHGGPTQVYMGPHTQIILGATTTPRPNDDAIPAKAETPKPKPSYTPPQPNTSPLKTDHHSWPKSTPPQHHHENSPSRPNPSPKNPDPSTRPHHDTRGAEPAHAQQPKVVLVPGRTPDHHPAARSQALKEQGNTAKVVSAAAGKTNATQVGGHGLPVQSNSSMSSSGGGKAEQHSPKAVLLHEKVPSSMPTATAAVATTTTTTTTKPLLQAHQGSQHGGNKPTTTTAAAGR